MARKHSRYLFLRGDNYYFRTRVPADLMPIIGASEIRKSLGTVDRGKAIIRSRRLSAGILEVFEQARMSDLRRSEVKKRLEKVYSENLEIQRKFIDRVGPKSFKRVKFLETISDQYKAFAELVREGNLEGFEQALEASEHSEFLKNRITRARGKAGYTLEAEDKARERVLYAEVLDMLSDSYHDTAALHQGERSYTSTGRENPSGGSSIALKMALSGYVDEKMRAGAWTDKTRAEMEGIFGSLIEMVGNIDLEDITRSKATGFKDVLLKLPRNFKTLSASRYEGMAIREMADLGLVSTLSAKTINKYLVAVSGVFQWAVNQGYCQNNYFKPLLIPLGSGARENKRDIFTPDELKLIVQKVEDETSEWKKWVVLIGIYSGMRLNEISQLYLEDIQEIEGILCFKVTDEREDQKLKNAASRRLVPVLSAIEEDLLAYIHELKEKGEERLFPEFNHNQNGYGDKASKWFNRTFKNKLGIEDKGKVFHSFRHNFITALKRLGVEETFVKALVGHKEGSITYGLYGRGHEVSSLKEIIDKIVLE